ncbi:MAG: DUF2079 domain-containing protein, partial [Chitinivibrionales bacterium]|nr:DUF2079 domain-containing protein [Chitinivibrionales bacterium]MBD3396554.1 DUF2079 domain-containing protein [Chitinivibrionales bacterium]
MIKSFQDMLSAFRARQRCRFALILVLAGFLCYVVAFSVLCMKRYDGFNYGIDLGNMVQAFYSTLDGRILEMTVMGAEYNASRLTGHIELLYLLLVPIFAVFRHAYTLLILQTVALGLGGIAVFYLADHLLRDTWTSATLAFAYWLYPYLATSNFCDFRADAFMVVPHIMAWYFLARKQDRLFWIAIAAGMLAKEYAFAFNALLALVIWRDHKRKAVVLLGLAAAQIWLFTPLVHIMAGAGRLKPILEEQTRHYLGFDSLSSFGAHALELGRSFRYVSTILVLLLIFNVALFRFRSGLVLIIPLFAVLTLTQLRDSAPFFGGHHQTILIAPLFITLVEGVRRMRPAHRLRYVLLGVLLPAAAVTLLYPRTTLGGLIAEMTYRS